MWSTIGLPLKKGDSSLGKLEDNVHCDHVIIVWLVPEGIRVVNIKSRDKPWTRTQQGTLLTGNTSRPKHGAVWSRGALWEGRLGLVKDMGYIAAAGGDDDV